LPHPLHFALKIIRHFCFFKRGTENFVAAYFWLNVQLVVNNLTIIKIMKPIIWDKIVLVLGISSIAIPAFAGVDISTTNQSQTMLTPQQFVSDAAVGGITEILLSEEALERSTNCASLHVEYPQMTRKFFLPTLLLHLGIIFRVIKHECYCENCHCIWNLPERLPATRPVPC
jgi:hypothetical protein